MVSVRCGRKGSLLFELGMWKWYTQELIFCAVGSEGKCLAPRGIPPPKKIGFGHFLIETAGGFAFICSVVANVQARCRVLKKCLSGVCLS